MSKDPKNFSKHLEKSSKYLEISRIYALKKVFLNPLGQKFLQRELKSMLEARDCLH